ncbi:MAG: hypothetical protein JNK84_07885 [Phreatobacter sp.]|uniref:hypothetical protein n=1 Tax=Phreatobacter sp. TaxID=1966341 RepID=UPI001A4683B2|nr:hypothetical protein [Phreatobacter sp.]MBL8568991.1 hypothetical protein [Phreatobacter sp.]
MRRLVRPFIVLAALVILLETWIWERVGPIIARLVELLPLKAVKQAIHDGIQRLPPYATLAVFAIPAILLFPFKLAALALIARGHLILGGGVFFLAKVVGVGSAAFLFDACKPKLMQIPLFVWAYEHWLRWLAWAHGHIDPIKERIRRVTRILSGGRPNRALRLLMRFRRSRRERMRPASAPTGA